MASFYEISKNIIFKFGWSAKSLPDNLQDPERNFFEYQCKVLGEQVSLVKEIFSDHLVSGVELQRVVELGETLIKECQIRTCARKAYLRREERAKAFEEALKEILWCISVRAYNHKRLLSGNPSLSAIADEFPQAVLGAREQYVMQRAAFADEKVLRSALSSWIKNHKCSAEECGRPPQLSQDLCLGSQIQTRWDSEGEGGVRRKMSEKEVEGDCRCSPWAVVQKSLQDANQIDKGGFGAVFETRWLGNTYAKKELNAPYIYISGEVNALAKLNHPNIVKVYASGSSESRTSCFFLMEKMPGNLRKYMNSRMNDHINPPVSIPAGIDLMLQLSEAMSYMNSHGMVHRDLKAENILVKPVDDPELLMKGFVAAKLADFGLAKVKNEVTSHMTWNTGTRLWMAPELFGAQDEENSRGEFLSRMPDVYSFGIVCSEILTGKVPYDGHPAHDHPRDLYKLIRDPDNPLRPELPESCPDILACLIRDCWHTDPERRPTFDEISMALRYFKGVGMMEEWPELRDEAEYLATDGWRILRARFEKPMLCTDAVQNIVEEKNRLESDNSRLKKELIDSQLATAKARQELEDERKARQLIEEERTKLTEERRFEQAEMEAMKRQSQQARKLIEEERTKLIEEERAVGAMKRLPQQEREVLGEEPMEDDLARSRVEEIQEEFLESRLGRGLNKMLRIAIGARSEIKIQESVNGGRPISNPSRQSIKSQVHSANNTFEGALCAAGAVPFDTSTSSIS